MSPGSKALPGTLARSAAAGPASTRFHYADRRAERRAQPPSYASSGWLGIGIVWAIISAIVWAYTDSAANTCKNALVGALDQSQCTTVTFWHDIAGISVLLAILTIIFAGIAMARRSN
jgi:hypothetical protein